MGKIVAVNRVFSSSRLEPWLRAALPRAGIVPLALLAVAAGAFLLFGHLAGEVMEGDTASFDRALLLALRDPADLTVLFGPPWLGEAARDITALGGTAVLLLVSAAVIVFLILLRRPGTAVLVLAATGGGTVLSALLKEVIGRTRPDVVPHAVLVQSASFPSGHAMLSAVTYLTIAALLVPVVPRRAARAFVILSAVALVLLIGASRVFLGVHWPTDVLAGWCVGAAWAVLCGLAAHWLRRRGAVTEPPAAEPE
jgi:undecaprenyl-diphosphatase